MGSRTCLIILIISDQTAKGILGMPRIVHLVLVILGVEVPFHSIPTKDTVGPRSIPISMARKQEERLQAEKLKKDEDLVPEILFRPSCFPATAMVMLWHLLFKRRTPLPNLD